MPKGQYFVLILLGLALFGWGMVVYQNNLQSKRIADYERQLTEILKTLEEYKEKQKEPYVREEGMKWN